jgi:hypothetical protein
MARHCLRSVLLNPPAFMMRICFKTVDLPLSPAPAACSAWFVPRLAKRRTEQQQLHLALLLLLVISDALFDILIASTLRVDRFLAKAHYTLGHSRARGAVLEARRGRGWSRRRACRGARGMQRHEGQGCGYLQVSQHRHTQQHAHRPWRRAAGPGGAWAGLGLYLHRAMSGRRSQANECQGRGVAACDCERTGAKGGAGGVMDRQEKGAVPNMGCWGALQQVELRGEPHGNTDHATQRGRANGDSRHAAPCGVQGALGTTWAERGGQMLVRGAALFAWTWARGERGRRRATEAWGGCTTRRNGESAQAARTAARTAARAEQKHARFGARRRGRRALAARRAQGCAGPEAEGRVCQDG